MDSAANKLARNIIIMMKKILLSLSLVIILYSTSFSQQDSVQWDKLIKKHKNVEVIYDKYIDKFWTYVSTSPQIFLDTIAVLQPKVVDVLPSPIEGTEKFIDSIVYPEIAKRAAIEGTVVLSASIDTTGNLKNIKIRLSDPGLFQYQIVDLLNKTKFIPAIQNGKPVEVQIAIAFSFVLYKKKNVQIDTVIFYKSSCDGQCPAYEITLNRNGEVIYEGRYYVDKIGKWKSKLKSHEFEGLISLLFAVDFFGMKEEYKADVEGFSWIAIRVKTPETTKEVSTNYYLPLWEVGKLADYLTKDLKWEKIEE